MAFTFHLAEPASSHLSCLSNFPELLSETTTVGHLYQEDISASVSQEDPCWSLYWTSCIFFFFL